MITLTREEAQQVLNALIEARSSMQYGSVYDKATETLRAKLSEPEPGPITIVVATCVCGRKMQVTTNKQVQFSQQPEPEPAAWMWDVYNGAGYSSRGIGFQQTDIPFAKHTPLYTAPPQREFIGLTDEEKVQVALDCDCISADWVKVVETTEAKLREKNTS